MVVPCRASGSGVSLRLSKLPTVTARVTQAGRARPAAGLAGKLARDYESTRSLPVNSATASGTAEYRVKPEQA